VNAIGNWLAESAASLRAYLDSPHGALGVVSSIVLLVPLGGLVWTLLRDRQRREHDRVRGH
jgi:hypothetical protein